jgi:D-aminopeptidase
VTSQGRITDVPGVRVGHRTLVDGDIRTGVTAIIPHAGDLYRDRPTAASTILNGFGKTIGLVQLDELGQLETPILLTNTLSVGTCANALIRRAIEANPGIGRRLPTVNPVVGECNDGFLNDIQAMAITEADAVAAIETAEMDFASGAVGAGAGMSCFGFKGGIGTASRPITLDGQTHHLGVLALCNFGRAGDLILEDGRRIGTSQLETSEKGSVIVIMATDIPLDHRQLQRTIRRFGAGLARVGSFWGHGSGDIAIGFTTANRTPLTPKSDIQPMRTIAESKIDLLFQAMADTTQHAVLDALMAAETTIGRAGNTRPGLRQTLAKDPR